MERQTQLPKLLKRKELAEVLSVPVSWIDRAVCEGRLPGVYRLGHRTVRFDPDEILTWLKTTKVTYITMEQDNEQS